MHKLIHTGQASQVFALVKRMAEANFMVNSVILYLQHHQEQNCLKALYRQSQGAPKSNRERKNFGIWNQGFLIDVLKKKQIWRIPHDRPVISVFIMLKCSCKTKLMMQTK